MPYCKLIARFTSQGAGSYSASGHEPPPVSHALPRAAALDVGDVGAQLERRLEVVAGRVALEGIEAVDGDPAAHEVEVRLGRRERSGRPVCHGRRRRGDREVAARLSPS